MVGKTSPHEQEYPLPLFFPLCGQNTVRRHSTASRASPAGRFALSRSQVAYPADWITRNPPVLGERVAPEGNGAGGSRPTAVALAFGKRAHRRRYSDGRMRHLQTEG
jgi:hypothetical protein